MKRTISSALLALILGVGTSLVPTSSFGAFNQGLTLPVTKNPIVNKGTKVGFTILSAQVQDNTDPKSKKAIPDRLALKVRNLLTKKLSNLEVFYTMKDQVTKASESYYQKLLNYSVQGKSVGYIYFDNFKGFGHFPENKFSIYRNSNNEVKFTIELSAVGFKPKFIVVTKAKGTTENPNG